MTTRTDLLGTWELVEMVVLVDDEVGLHPLGEQPVGQIIYGADGRMSALLMDPGRPWPEGRVFSLDATTQEQAEAAKQFLGYGGSFDLLDEVVVHHVSISLYPEMVGTDLVRTVTWQGEFLVLETERQTTRSGGATWGRLTWQRPS